MSIEWFPNALPNETLGEIIARIIKVNLDFEVEDVEIYCPYEPDPFYLPNAKKFTALSTHSIDYLDDHDNKVPLAISYETDEKTGRKILKVLLSMKDAIGTECWLDDDEV